ncbi:hypothetical protein B0J13DRAFT_419550, partial [Dactylonectria estremocensis]
MWLLNTRSLDLHYYPQPADCPAYAVLTHCLKDGELTDLHDLPSQNLVSESQRASCTVIREACGEAQSFGVEFIWLDEVCINRSSTAAISEALNSMFQIYQQADVCLVYLSDISIRVELLYPPETYIHQSQWGTRVWVLQEIIASKHVQFYDKQWTRIGTKDSLLHFLTAFLGIDRPVLENADCLFDFSIGRRMSWAAQLSADRPEDVAYSLLGIFRVNLSIIYGEGRRAFLRLQEEILRDTDDATLFAWQSASLHQYRGIFSNCPAEF